jgi:hypothetical protein
MTMLKTSELKKSAMLFTLPELPIVVPFPFLLLALPSSLCLTDAFLLLKVSVLPLDEPPRLPPCPTCKFDCIVGIWSFRGLLLGGGRGAVRLMLRFESLLRRCPGYVESDSPLWIT